MSVDDTDMIGHDMQWFLLFVGTHIVPRLSHGQRSICRKIVVLLVYSST